MKELSAEEKEQIIREVLAKADRRLIVELFKPVIREYLRLLGYEIYS